MKSLSELVLEADQNQSNNQGADQQQGNDNQDNNQNKPVKTDAGTFKEWPVFKTTMRGWIKVMSGQEEAKDTFFSAGFLVPTIPQIVDAKAAAATLSKQLDTQVTIKVSEFKNDYMFTIIGTKPGYVSAGWAKGKGPAIADMIKSMKAEVNNKNNDNNDNDNGNNGNNGDRGDSNGASM